MLFVDYDFDCLVLVEKQAKHTGKLARLKSNLLFGSILRDCLMSYLLAQWLFR